MSFVVFIHIFHPRMTSMDCENFIYHIFKWEFCYSGLWVLYFFLNFHSTSFVLTTALLVHLIFLHTSQLPSSCNRPHVSFSTFVLVLTTNSLRNSDTTYLYLTGTAFSTSVSLFSITYHSTFSLSPFHLVLDIFLLLILNYVASPKLECLAISFDMAEPSKELSTIIKFMLCL